MIEYKNNDAAELVTLALIKCWKKQLKGTEPPKEEIKEKSAENLLPVTKSEEEAKADKASENKKQKEAPKEEDTKNWAKICPLFNSEVIGVGISNKGHPTQKNVIQLLFVKTIQNSME